MPSLLLLYILDESIDSNLITIFQGVYVSEEVIFLPFFINLIFIISVSIIFFIFFICPNCDDKSCQGGCPESEWYKSRIAEGVYNEVCKPRADTKGEGNSKK